MGSILVTGYTGNVGYEVAKALQNKNAPIVCAVRDAGKATQILEDTYQYVKLNFEQPETFDSVLENVDRIFLMYPPNVKFQNFKHFLMKAKEKKIKHITYLSVKDVHYMPFIPHYKNEKEIQNTQIPYTFLRAGYFMQNLNMFLLDELKKNRRIFVPAGKGKTSFIDIRDIAEVAAISLINYENHKNKRYALTGAEAIDFFEVAKRMSEILHLKIEYTNPSTKQFKQYMLEKGLEEKFINVVAGLHIFTKIGLAKGITRDLATITNKKPIKLDTYINDYKKMWL